MDSCRTLAPSCGAVVLPPAPPAPVGFDEREEISSGVRLCGPAAGSESGCVGGSRMGGEEATSSVPSSIALLESAIDHYPPLSRALIDEDWELALTLVAQGADVAAVDPSGMAPLHWAAMQGRYDLVGAILAAVGDGGKRKRLLGQTEDDSPNTALHWAIRGGHSRCALSLIDAGSDLGAADDGGHTALHLACHFGLADVVSALVLRGADVWAEGPRAGDTPLEAAVAARRLDCVKLLLGVLERGASCGQRRSSCPACDGGTYSALELAVHHAMECPTPPQPARNGGRCRVCRTRCGGAVGLAVHKLRSGECGRAMSLGSPREHTQRQKQNV